MILWIVWNMVIGVETAQLYVLHFYAPFEMVSGNWFTRTPPIPPTCHNAYFLWNERQLYDKNVYLLLKTFVYHAFICSRERGWGFLLYYPYIVSSLHGHSGYVGKYPSFLLELEAKNQIESFFHLFRFSLIFQLYQCMGPGTRYEMASMALKHLPAKNRHIIGIETRRKNFIINWLSPPPPFNFLAN